MVDSNGGEDQGAAFEAGCDEDTRPLRTELFETCDDTLAAFLWVRGCRHVGLLIVTAPEGPTVAHAFDNDPAKLVVNVGAYVARKADAVPASAFADALAHLRTVRADHVMRMREREEALEGAD